MIGNRTKQRKMSRRKLLKWSLIISLALIVLIVVIHLIHALTLDRTIVYREITFRSINVPAHLDGYRIAFLADEHAMEESRLRAVVDELNSRNLDLLVLGGDFETAARTADQSIRILSEVQTRDGMFGVAGNHDRYHNSLFAALERYGATPLRNAGQEIRPGFFVAGTRDFWSGYACIATATQDADPDDFILLLTHNADVTMVQDTSHIDLTLSGHTHGGQISFFGIWAPYFTFSRHITSYGQRFARGWATSRDGTDVFVTVGIGEYLPRVFSRPEVIIITLRAR